MSQDAARNAESHAREERESELVRARLTELFERPITGRFDLKHLKAVHAYIFQDFPEHRPGIIRERTEKTWVKHRILEDRDSFYDVPYANQKIQPKLTAALRASGGPGAIEGQDLDTAAKRLAALYGDLDHAHGFYEGNSRTLREFTRSLAAAAGFLLDWIGTAIGPEQRNTLYLARDLAVFERAYPGLTPERAMETNDRAEYEASFVLARLRKAAGDQTLEAMIRARLAVLR